MQPATHLKDDDGQCSPNCFPCKLKTVTLAPSAMPTRNPQAARAKVQDPQLEKDRTAYRALRRDGTQPPSVKGAHELMTNANESWEVERNQIETNDAARKRMGRALAEMPAANGKPMVREDA